jgi:C-terminal processing protease CtpA/Prc
LGPTTLRDVLVASSGSMAQEPAIADLGAEAFKGSRIGIDYAHSTLYVEQVNSALTPGLDVVGLTLRPEVDGRYTVVAVVPFDGQPSVPDVRAGDVLIGVDGAPATGATLGQVWSLLGGAPGQVRKLIVERDGKRLAVDATVRRFLAAKAN